MSNNFWTAFYAGLSAPVMLFGHTPGYDGYIAVPTAAQSFAAVGAFLSAAATTQSGTR